MFTVPDVVVSGKFSDVVGLFSNVVVSGLLPDVVGYVVVPGLLPGLHGLTPDVVGYVLVPGLLPDVHGLLPDVEASGFLSGTHSNFSSS